VNRIVVIVAIGVLSLFVLGVERTLGCVLGSALALVVNGMCATKSADGRTPQQETFRSATSETPSSVPKPDHWIHRME
jgi:hypothetical protein